MGEELGVLYVFIISTYTVEKSQPILYVTIYVYIERVKDLDK